MSETDSGSIHLFSRLPDLVRTAPMLRVTILFCFLVSFVVVGDVIVEAHDGSVLLQFVDLFYLLP